MSIEGLGRSSTTIASRCLRIHYYPLLKVDWISKRPFNTSVTAFSGHNKWSTIKHKKAALDGAKQAAWQSISARIAVAVKLGGADPKSNPRLEQELARAKAENMTKDAVNRAIARGEPRTLGKDLSEMTFEVILPGGIAVVVEAMTDNKTRTAATIKSVIYPAGGSFSRILYNFVRKGVIIARCDGRPFDQVVEEVIDIGAQDIEKADDGSFRVYVEPQNVTNKARSFKNLGYDVRAAETVWMPRLEGQQQVEGSSEQAQKIGKVIDELEAKEDVTGVYSNAVFYT